MWYVAAVFMAQPKVRGKRRYLCESCNILLTASDAEEAYRKAVTWGVRYEADSIFSLKYLGIERLWEIGESIEDGVEIAGRFFHKFDVWNKRKGLIPSPDELEAIRNTRNMNTPLGQLMTPHQIKMLREGLRGRS